MSLLRKIKQPGFWSNFAKIAIPFFILLTVAMLLMNSWRDIFAGDFAKVNEVNFANGGWIRFFGFKVIISVVYGLWMTTRNTK
ncbi:hypothetical protein AAON49_13605 [Pseudotenacibaculum sp. MALMAid0570]|uniref:hypothetical protein n=1 Tax=Pseudotenacibaculum sp. MALMAid0570 TaxID=3143938 RepID=UPI0032DFDC55